MLQRENRYEQQGALNLVLTFALDAIRGLKKYFYFINNKITLILANRYRYDNRSALDHFNLCRRDITWGIPAASQMARIYLSSEFDRTSKAGPAYDSSCLQLFNHFVLLNLNSK